MGRMLLIVLLVGLSLGGLGGVSAAEYNRSNDYDELVLTVKSGDTLSQILNKAGINTKHSVVALEELRNVYDVSTLNLGQKISVRFSIDDSEGETLSLQGLKIFVDGEHEVEVVRLTDEIFLAKQTVKELSTRVVKVNGQINSALFTAARNYGMPPEIVMKLIKVMSYDVDFQRDIKKGNWFEVLYEQFVDEEGSVVRDGEIVFASLKLDNKNFKIYRHAKNDGQEVYFDEDGNTVARSLLRTPVDGARISSGYGKRRHPVLGYTKLHKGVDFAAPRGTPIYAAGGGVIKFAGRKGSYGKFIKIEHNKGFKTAYAHISRFAKGIRVGQKINQGQVIAYVGSTGRSTGPHLHYEVFKNDRRVNPLSIKTTPKYRLTGVERAIFEKHKNKIETVLADTPAGVTVASR